MHAQSYNCTCAARAENTYLFHLLELSLEGFEGSGPTMDKESSPPEAGSFSITDSTFDRELAFTDAAHYISVATKSGVPISSGTPVHKHS